MDTIMNRADLKNVKIDVKIPPHFNVTGDKNLLIITLRNLLSNAIKFSYPGEEVNVDAYREDDDIYISVKDFGTGIDEEEIPKLFKIKEKQKKTGTDKETGTGLGLIICKEFIELHNGRIEVESKLGMGSTFTIVIPEKV